LHEGRYREVTLYEALRPPRNGGFDAGSFLYFERSVLEEIRESGRRAADAWLAAGPPIDQLDDVMPAEAEPQRLPVRRARLAAVF
jgi:hypothetical protein